MTVRRCNRNDLHGPHNFIYVQDSYDCPGYVGDTEARAALELGSFLTRARAAQYVALMTAVLAIGVESAQERDVSGFALALTAMAFAFVLFWGDRRWSR